MNFLELHERDILCERSEETPISKVYNIMSHLQQNLVFFFLSSWITVIKVYRLVFSYNFKIAEKITDVSGRKNLRVNKSIE